MGAGTGFPALAKASFALASGFAGSSSGFPPLSSGAGSIGGGAGHAASFSSGDSGFLPKSTRTSSGVSTLFVM